MFKLTSAQFAATHTLSAAPAPIRSRLPTRFVADAAFAGVSGIERLQFGDFVNSITLSTNANAAFAGGTLTIDDIAAVTATSNLTVNGSAFTANLLIFTGAGNDSLIGGSGNDTFSFTSGHLTSGDTVTGNGGADTIQITDARSLAMPRSPCHGDRDAAARDFTNSVAWACSPEPPSAPRPARR